MALPGIPTAARWIADGTGYLTQTITQWLQPYLDAVNASPQRVGTASGGGSAAKSTTTLPIQSVTAGLYRVSYVLQITTPGTVSSSATFTLGWTNANGVACSQSGAALTGNTTATQQNGTFVVNVSASSNITYAVAYASVGATAMVYSVNVTAEQLP